MQYDFSRIKGIKMKAALKKLEAATAKFSDSVSNFPVGAISIDDFKPIEEKIEATRKSLKHLNSELLLFKTKYQSQLDEGETVESESVLPKIKDASMRVILVDKIIRKCLESNAIKEMLSDVKGDSSIQMQVYYYMKKALTLNNNVLLLQEKIINDYHEQLDLKIECHNAFYEHKSFLKKQEEAKAKNQEGIKPGMSKSKERVQTLMKKINLMKRLITSFIGSSGKMLKTHPTLLLMLEKHSKLISTDQLSKMVKQ